MLESNKRKIAFICYTPQIRQKEKVKATLRLPLCDLVAPLGLILRTSMGVNYTYPLT